MQIGFNAPTSGPLIAADSLTRIITEGEALGFDYVTISDHIMVPRNLESKYPYTDTGEFPAGTQAAWLEQLATTAYIAALTKRLRFVLSVMVVPHRPAVLTAKILATIDFLIERPADTRHRRRLVPGGIRSDRRGAVRGSRIRD